MDLVLTVCLVADLATCRNERLSMSVEPTGPLACLVGAAPVVAQWSEHHPKWKVQEFRCEQAGRRKIEA